MGTLHLGGDLVFPSLLQPPMVREKSGVGLDPAFCVTAEATTRDDQVDIW
jgi:hypothetical protein